MILTDDGRIVRNIFYVIVSDHYHAVHCSCLCFDHSYFISSFKSGKWCASQTFKLIDKQIDNAESQTEQQRVQQECASTVHNSFMISGKEDGEKYLGIPFAEFVSVSVLFLVIGNYCRESKRKTSGMRRSTAS